MMAAALSMRARAAGADRRRRVRRREPTARAVARGATRRTARSRRSCRSRPASHSNALAAATCRGSRRWRCVTASRRHTSAATSCAKRRSATRPISLSDTFARPAEDAGDQRLKWTCGCEERCNAQTRAIVSAAETTPTAGPTTTCAQLLDGDAARHRAREESWRRAAAGDAARLQLDRQPVRARRRDPASRDADGHGQRRPARHRRSRG